MKILAIDELLAAVRAMCTGDVEEISIYVRRDGRVDIWAEGQASAAGPLWRERADLDPGSPFPLPSEALCIRGMR